MQAIVLAAGAGTRLARGPKAFVPLLGLTLAERCVLALSRAGVDEFVVVVGAGAQAAHEALVDRLARRGLRVTLVRNEGWHRGNAISVLAARAVARDRFIVAMADHVFDPGLVASLLASPAEFAVVVDRRPRYVRWDEATHVRVEGGRAIDARKGLEPADGVDAGLFISSAGIFDTLEAAAAEGVESWSEVFARMRPAAVWTEGAFWIDVDTAEDHARAEKLLLSRLGKAEDGPVSRYLNRPISRRISRHLVATRVHANTISAASFLLSAAAGFAFGFADTWAAAALAGALAQLASIIDGVDGEIARLRLEESQLGGWLDAVLDRYADVIVLGGIAWGASAAGAYVWLVAVAAILGAMAVSYTAARYEAAFRAPGPWVRGAIPAKRDTRLFVVLVGGLANAPLLTLLAISVLSHAEVVRRLLVASRVRARGGPRGPPLLS
jgi:CDP-L-myo-inositol myo-inositolphosphotransferase